MQLKSLVTLTSDTGKSVQFAFDTDVPFVPVAGMVIGFDGGSLTFELENVFWDVTSGCFRAYGNVPIESDNFELYVDLFLAVGFLQRCPAP